MIELARSGEELEAVVPKNARASVVLRDAGIRVHACRNPGHGTLADVMQLRRVLRDSRIDLIHSHTRFDLWRGSLSLFGDARRRHVHSVYMNVAPKRDLAHRLLFSKVDAVVSSSEFSNRKIAAAFPVAPDAIHLVRYGRDLQRYAADPARRTALREKMGCGPGDLVVGMACRIDAQKGVREFAESLLSLSTDARDRVKYWMIGEPTIAGVDAAGRPVFEESGAALESWLSAFIASERLGDRFARIPFQDDIVPWLDAMDVFVLASYAEMYSLAVVDAMAMGLPVIGTNAEGTPEQVRDVETGILVEPRSAEEIAAAVERYAADPALRAAHGAAGREWVRREHAMDESVRRMRAIYASVLRG
jgi:hypothetical protein